jgi:hypothetical protein
MASKGLQSPARGRFPQPDRLVAARRGQPLAVWTEGHSMNDVGVPLQDQGQTVGGKIPHFDGFVPPGGREQLAVRAEDHAPHCADMVGKDLEFLARGRFADGHDAVIAGRGDAATVRAESDGADALAVYLQ